MTIHRRLLGRTAVVLPLLAAMLDAAPPATPTVAAPPACQFRSADGGPNPITHVIHLQFDNVHFTRDNPNVPSDLEQMPHLLNFIESNGTLLANEHTPLIAHTYWTDRVAGNPANPLEMVDSAGNKLQAPWVPFVQAGCNFGAVSTANMVLENATTDVAQVFNGNPPASDDAFNDFVGDAAVDGGHPRQ